MGQNIDYSTVEAHVAAMKDIADKIGNCKNVMRYYCYGSQKCEGEFFSSFEGIKVKIQCVIGDMETFIDSFADVIDMVAKNFEAIDAEMRKSVYDDMWLMA